MSLRHAVLASLLDGDASGYDLGKRMDLSIANYWHASRQQIYSELARLNDEGLAKVTDVVQTGRPSKRVYSITAAGKKALSEFTRQPAPSHAIKDQLLIQVQAADIGDINAVIAGLHARRAESAVRLATYERLIHSYLRGRTEAEYLASARRIGPYLNLRRGRDFEHENLTWTDWATGALQARAHSRRAPTAATADRQDRRDRIEHP
jgi:DNA-binding PadR family transcriptional regulator